MARKPKTPKEPITYHESWRCETCGVDFLDGRKSFIEHMKTVHAMPDECRAKKQLTLAMDMADSYSNHYEWEWPTLNVKASQQCSGPRDKSWY